MYVLFAHPQNRREVTSARYRIATNNPNKITSAESLHPERSAGLKPPKKPGDFPIQAPRTCKRATLSMRKGHSCASTVALLQARLASFMGIFGPKIVSTKFKQLIVSVLETSSKSLICAQVGRSLQISQAERLKTNK